MAQARCVGVAACLMLLAGTAAHGAPGWGAPDSPATAASQATSGWTAAGATETVVQQCANSGPEVYLNGACFPLANYWRLNRPNDEYVYLYFVNPVPEAANGVLQSTTGGGSINLQVRDFEPRGNPLQCTEYDLQGVSSRPGPSPPTPAAAGQTLWTLYAQSSSEKTCPVR